MTCACQQRGPLKKSFEGGDIVTKPRWVRFNHDGTIDVCCQHGEEHHNIKPKRAVRVMVKAKGAH